MCTVDPGSLFSSSSFFLSLSLPRPPPHLPFSSWPPPPFFGVWGSRSLRKSVTIFVTDQHRKNHAPRCRTSLNKNRMLLTLNFLNAGRAQLTPSEQETFREDAARHGVDSVGPLRRDQGQQNAPARINIRG